MARRPTRAEESRNAEQRYVIDDYRSALPKAPEDEIPDGVVYRWVAETVNGAMWEQNVRAKIGSGWKAVPAERHPSLSSAGLFPGARASIEHSTVIRHNGLVLCEKEKRLVDAERAALLRENLEIMQSAPGLSGLPGRGGANGGIVLRNESSVTHGFQDD